MTRWGVDQVLGLAPDESAKKAAKSLTSPAKWSDTGSTEILVWGKCQGSGKEPYQVSVDLNGPAFRCTCPSRKFPCKHGLALLLLWAANDGAVGDAMEAAPFADEWAAERAKKDDARAEKAEKKAEKVAAELADPEIREKREATRIGKISKGLDDLDQWLQDIVRQGLATAKTAPYSFWDTQAARLVDAQAPGVAERVSELASIIAGRTDWSQVLLRELGLLHLIVRGWRNRDELPEPLAADLRTVIGWSRSLDEVRVTSSEKDRWLVVGVRQDGEGKRVRSQRTWLWGLETKQWALLLDFATGGMGFGVSQIIGAELHGDASFFPGSAPKRALLENGVAGASHPQLPHEIGYTSIADALNFVAESLAANPWVKRLPIVLHNVRLDVQDSSLWHVVDEHGHGIELGFQTSGWEALVAAGKNQCTLSTEFDDGTLWPLSISTEHGWIPL
jgi:hypothetical protein